MNQARKRTGTKKVLSMILVLVMLLSLLSMAAFTLPTAASSGNSYDYNIMFLDCGRKYFSVDSIEKIIDNASAAGFNYIQLAVGNDGLRFLLDDMSLTVKGTTYTSEQVSSAIHTGNEKYYDFPVDELTETEMNTIITYAQTKGMGVIPCVNTPGHMDAILSAATSLTGKTCSYDGSARTIDVTNDIAVAFTQALLQKYITYFAGKGCQLFNMGADEYANDKYPDGAMGFGNLQTTRKYSYYVNYVNKVATMIKNAGMKPMAFNDGIYFNNNTSSGTFDTDIIICYWSNGWTGYSPMSETNLVAKGFKLINTNGSYYWVLGKTDAQCSASKARGFNETSFPSGRVDNPVGSMFCIWADYPGAETEASVISKTADTIAAFGKTLPEVKKVETVESKTVTKDNVTVTAPGLTDLTVAAADAPAIDAAAEGKVVAYDVTPATASGSYEKNGTVTLRIPEGWDASRVRGYVVNGDGSVTTGLTGTIAGDKFTFTVPHFSEMGIYELAANAATKTKEITLTVGGTTTDKIDGEYPGTKLDNNVASVVGGAPTDKPGTTTYVPATLGAGDFYVSTKSGDTAPTVQLTFEDAGNGQYYIKNSDGKYLYPTADYNWWDWDYSVTTTTKNEDAAVKVVTNNDGSIVISKTVTSGWSRTTAYLTLNGTSLGASGNSTSLYLYDQQTTHGGKETTLTFTGKSVGTTKVTIGNTQYIIKVTAEDLSKVTPLKLEYWITNAPISTVSDTYDTRTNTKSQTYKAYYTAIAADYNTAVATADGVDVTTFAPAKTGHESRDVYYWRCRMLNTALTNTSTNQTEQQTNDAGDDETVSGIGFTKIRYYESKWQVFTDNNAWVDVTSTKQLVAYYREYIKVTDEVESFAADWGKLGDGSVSGTYLNPSSVNTISYQVVYEDGKTNPSDTTAAALASKTLCYGHWDNGRGIGTIMLSDTADYEIYKVTAETGTMAGKSNSSGDYGNYTVSSFSWNKDEATVWDEESDQKETNGDVVIHNNANTPNKEGNYRNLTWLDNKESILIRVYVRAKTVDGALTVHYVDETTSAEFYNYNIIVSNTASNKTTFKENISLAHPWKGDLANGDVVNKFGATQTVTADLGKMPAIPAKYRYAVDYTCVRVVRSADGTEVTLYYTFKTDKTFVVDFGLPLVIQPTDISANLGLATLTSVTAKSSTKTDYAEIITNSENCNITYKLKTMLNGADKLDVKYDGTIPIDDGTQTGSVSYEIGIIPASTVYYEDNFVKFSDGWTQAGTTEKNAVQHLDELGKEGANNYGYDAQYKNFSTYSLGSAMKTTVSSDTNSNPPKATFTFKGTGFDLVSMTSKDTGTILVNVVGKDSEGNSVTKNWIVDTFYGYTREPDGFIEYTWTKGSDGTWHNKAVVKDALPAGATTGGTPTKSGDKTYEPNYIWKPAGESNNALYQIPVIHYTDLPYGEYTVTVTPKYSSSRDPYYDANGGNNSYDFYLDGVRIYNPAGDKLNSQYVKDGEGYAQFTEIRNMLLSTSGLTANIQPKTGMVFVDGVGDKGTLADYTNYGPNNEVYLARNQAIAFKISDMSNVASIQIGAKAPNGNATMQIKVGSNEVQTQELKTASDMYYKLNNVQADQTIVITNTSDSLLSLTTLKVTYKNDPSASNSADPVVDEEVVAQAPVMLMSMLYGEPQTFEPGHFTAKWSRNVRKGGTATLTVKASADVESITVDGQPITTYTTKTARSVWGAKETYHVFTYRVTNAATADYSICAVNADGVVSDPITAKLTVRPSIRDWWNGIFDKWKH